MIAPDDEHRAGRFPDYALGNRSDDPLDEAEPATAYNRDVRVNLPRVIDDDDFRVAAPRESLYMNPGMVRFVYRLR